MFQIKFVEKIKTHILFNIFFLESCHLWDNVENMVQPNRLQMATIIQCMRFVCYTNTPSGCVRLHVFNHNNGFANAPQYYVISTLPVSYFPLGLTPICTQEKSLRQHYGGPVINSWPTVVNNNLGDILSLKDSIEIQDTLTQVTNEFTNNFIIKVLDQYYLVKAPNWSVDNGVCRRVKAQFGTAFWIRQRHCILCSSFYAIIPLTSSHATQPLK